MFDQFYILSKAGKIRFFQALHDKAGASEQEYVAGVIWTLKTITKQFDPQDKFTAYSTAQYSCHYYETPTGYGFVALGEPNVGPEITEQIQTFLLRYYREVFVAFSLTDFEWNPDEGRFSDDFVQATKAFWLNRAQEIKK